MKTFLKNLVVVLSVAALLWASAQSAKKAAPSKPAPTPPAPPQMSHDFRTAGRRAVAAINDLGRQCTIVCGSIDDVEGLYGKASKAIEEADAQHDNAVDKQSIDLLKGYNDATFDAVMDREAFAIEAKDKQLGMPTTTNFHKARCNAGACEAMYATCKKEAEEAFETGIMPAKVQCKSLSPRDSK